MTKLGRPHGCTPEVQQTICEHIRSGNRICAAARAANVHPVTVYKWLARGRAGEQPFEDFGNAVKEAVAASEIALVAIIASAAASDWKAALVLLERRFRKAWGRGPSTVVQSGAVAGGKALSPAEFDEELLRAIKDRPDLLERLKAS